MRTTGFSHALSRTSRLWEGTDRKAGDIDGKA